VKLDDKISIFLYDNVNRENMILSYLSSNNK